jgi:hypothetical protein
MSGTSSLQIPTTLTDLSTKEKMAILMDFWIDRQSAIAKYSYQARTTAAGTWVDRKCSSSTNGGMFFAFVGVIVGFYFLHKVLHKSPYFGGSDETTAGHSLLYILLFISVSGFVLFAMVIVRRFVYSLFALRWTRARKREFQTLLSRSEFQSVLDDEVEESTVSNSEAIWRVAARGLRRFFFRCWIRLNFFTPFNYKFIWWWTLIAGVATAEMDYLAQAYGPSPNKPSDLWLSFMRAIVISVIAYIATNIIRELLYLREDYSSSVTSVRESNRTADELKSTLSSFRNEEIPQLINISKIAIGTSDIADSIKELLEKTTEQQDDNLLKQSEVFVFNLKAVINNFINQITQPSDPFVKQCVLLTLNRYLVNEADILGDTRKRVISQFSTLADIGKELIQSSYRETEVVQPDPDNYEFYGLMVIPPVKFLNYDERGHKDDDKWQQYLLTLIQAAQRQIPVKKYFLSLTANDRKELLRMQMENETSPEAYDLHSEEIYKQLDRFVKVGANGIPECEAVRAGALEKKYTIEEGPKPDTGWRRLGDVIHDTYHMPDHCFVREFSMDQFMDSLWDNKRKLPLDYFAVRKNEEWVFCLKTRYHKNLDAADIEVFHDGMSEEWTTVKAKLNCIFFPHHDSGIFPIGQYKKDFRKEPAATEPH